MELLSLAKLWIIQKKIDSTSLGEKSKQRIFFAAGNE
jgi:hypothetical protein